MLAVPTLPPAAKVSLLEPAPRSTDIAVVSVVPSVMVSGPCRRRWFRCWKPSQNWCLDQGERVGTTAEVDRGVADRSGEYDCIRPRRNQRINRAECRRVGAIAEGKGDGTARLLAADGPGLGRLSVHLARAALLREQMAIRPVCEEFVLAQVRGRPIACLRKSDPDIGPSGT